MNQVHSSPGHRSWASFLAVAAGFTTLASGQVQVIEGEHGLLGYYYNDPAFNELSVLQVDEKVHFLWNANAPDPSLPRDGFSVRWTGAIVPPHSATYTFVIHSDGLVKLWIDGQLVVDGSRSPGSRSSTGQVALTAAQ